MELVDNRKMFYDEEEDDDEQYWSNSPIHWIAQVDAWYDPYHKKVVFPPGLCSAPLFTPLYSDHARYGMMGFIIAHELTHVVDEFVPQSEKAITTRTFLEFDKMAPQRISENIADRIAISVVTQIMQEDYPAADASSVEVCKMLLAFGQLWCTNEGNEDDRQDYTLSNDVHSSFRNRLKAPLALLFKDNPSLRKDCFCIKK